MGGFERRAFGALCLALLCYAPGSGLTRLYAVTGGSERAILKQSVLESFSAAPGTEPLAALACPKSLAPLREELRAPCSTSLRRTLICSKLGSRYDSKAVADVGSYFDLVSEPAQRTETVQELLQQLLSSAFSSPVSRLQQVGQEMFRSPYIAFLYERGWRQNFRNAGFRPEEVEFAEIMDFFMPVVTARAAKASSATVLDLSCGSGLWTRRLTRSAKFSTVYAGDYSDAMIVETLTRLKNDGLPTEGPTAPVVVRLDAGALPFQSKGLSTVHAGAALHCWPSAEDGVKEVYRVLEDGGRFYATTFLRTAYGLNPRLSGQTTNGFRFFQLDELRDIMTGAGFAEEDVDVRKVGNGCAIVKCVKKAA